MSYLSALLSIVLVSLTFRFAPVSDKRTVPGASDTLRPHIVFDSTVVDLGRVPADTTATHTYTLFNRGATPLRIKGVYPSCGCTVAKLDDSVLAPGANSRIHIKFDTHNKGLGPVMKTIRVFSNDPIDSSIQLRFQASIFRDTIKEHAGLRDTKAMMHLDGIFKGDCARCHVEKGKGLIGMQLFEADCAICHGPDHEGKPGPELTSANMMAHTTSQWTTIISKGIPNSNMPGFATVHGGPLSDEHIASVVEYLNAVKKEYRKALSHPSVGAK